MESIPLFAGIDYHQKRQNAAGVRPQQNPPTYVGGSPKHPPNKCRF
ncbi:MAG: hypothetical protein ACRCUY_03385 [Thermoguttaceae bacterium]